MNNAARAAVLEAHCRELKLPSVRRLYPDLVRQATHDGWDYEEFLLQLLEAEVLTRRDGAVARLLRQARFPDLKTFEQLDWEALGGVERPQLAQFATCEYIERADDVVRSPGRSAPARRTSRSRSASRPPAVATASPSSAPPTSCASWSRHVTNSRSRGSIRWHEGRSPPQGGYSPPPKQRPRWAKSGSEEP